MIRQFEFEFFWIGGLILNLLGVFHYIKSTIISLWLHFLYYGHLNVSNAYVFLMVAAVWHEHRYYVCNAFGWKYGYINLFETLHI